MTRLFFCLFSIVLSCQLNAATAVSPKADSASYQITLSDIRDLNNRTLKEKLGRRLSLRESIAFGIIRRKLKRAERATARSEDPPSGFLATSAFTAAATGWGAVLLASLTGVGFLWWIVPIGLLLGIILGAIGKKKYKEKDLKKYRLAKAAFWIGLLGFLLAGVAFIVLVSAWTAFLAFIV